MVRAVVASVLMAFVGGVGVGRLTAPATRPPEPAPVPVRPVATPSRTACPTPPLADEPADTDLALQLCEAQLAVSRMDQTLPRFAWDVVQDLEGIEPPSTWVPTIEAAFAECDIPADLVAVDCSEPPCVGGLRGHGSTDEIDQALHDCDAFAARFGDERGGVMPVVTRCPDGSVQRMHLLATYDDDEVDAYFQATGIRGASDDELDLWFEGFRILARRTDSLASQWDCSPDE
ncbi:MAG: hypothetical protein AAF602_14755 [Myxococcota bacterium]